MASIPNRSNVCSLGFSEILGAFPLERIIDSQLLSGELIQSVCAKHRCLFGGIFHTAFVIWAMLSQVLRDGKEASCQSAVARIIQVLKNRGLNAPHANSGNYCRARSKLKASAIRELCKIVSKSVEKTDSLLKRWNQRRVVLIDGFTIRMPDSHKNRSKYPHHKAQKQGVGFPIARCIGVFNLANGCLIDSALGPYLGKQTGETALLRQAIDSLEPHSVVVADRHYCSYWIIYACISRGVHVCFRKHQSKHTDFRRGERLGKDDHIVTWDRPKKPEWMSQEEYETYPDQLHLREIRYVVTTPGRKQTPFIVVTSFLSTSGEEGASRNEISELYGARWQVELNIRHIKSNLNADFMRCKSPELVELEFWMKLLAYNLIRASSRASVSEDSSCEPSSISFVGTCQAILAAWDTSIKRINQIHVDNNQRLGKSIIQLRVGNRPGRFEPRCVRRRRDQYKLMNEPRNALRKRLSKGDNSFE